jgi:hypothetical protein
VKKIVIVGALLVSACSLYEGGDDVPGDVDGGAALDAAPTVAGIYRVTFTCVGTCEANPLEAMERAWIIDGNPLEVEWSRIADPAPSFTHRGSMAADNCAEMSSGDDGTATHGAYRLCPSGAGLSADVTWTTSTAFSTWHVAMSPL